MELIEEKIYEEPETEQPKQPKPEPEVTPTDNTETAENVETTEDNKIKCDKCNKLLSRKTFLYGHKKCKQNEPTNGPLPALTEETTPLNDTTTEPTTEPTPPKKKSPKKATQQTTQNQPILKPVENMTLTEKLMKLRENNLRRIKIL